jgi:hypothetical protein
LRSRSSRLRSAKERGTALRQMRYERRRKLVKRARNGYKLTRGLWQQQRHK